MASLTETGTAATSPVTLTEAKAWLNIEVTDDDGIIQDLLDTAFRQVLDIMQLPMKQQQYVWTLDNWPRWRLPQVTFQLSVTS